MIHWPSTRELLKHLRVVADKGAEILEGYRPVTDG